MEKHEAREKINKSLDEIEEIFISLSTGQFNLADVENLSDLFNQHLASVRKLVSQNLRE